MFTGRFIRGVCQDYVLGTEMLTHKGFKIVEFTQWMLMIDENMLVTWNDWPLTSNQDGRDVKLWQWNRILYVKFNEN